MPAHTFLAVIRTAESTRQATPTADALIPLIFLLITQQGQRQAHRQSLTVRFDHLVSKVAQGPTGLRADPLGK